MKNPWSMLVAAAMVLPVFARAQNQAVVAEPPPALGDIQKAQADRAALRAKEIEAVDFVRNDKSLTSIQKRAKIKEIHQDYRAQAKAAREKYAAQKKALRAEARKGRRALRQERAHKR